jgi:hypothetical protein
MSHGLKRLPETYLAELPRMADFAVWATACETCWFEPGSFMDAYTANQRFAVEATIQASPFMSWLWSLLASRKPEVGDYWEGTCGMLLGDLNQHAKWSPEMKAPPGWPTSESGVSRNLDRAAGPFRQAGVSIQRAPRKVRILREADLSSPQPCFNRRSVRTVGSVDGDEKPEASDHASLADIDASNAIDASSGQSISRETAACTSTGEAWEASLDGLGLFDDGM